MGKFQGRSSPAKAQASSKPEYVQLPRLEKFGVFEEKFAAGRAPDFLRENYINHPVVFLDFSHVKGETFEEVLHYFLHKVIKPEFERHFSDRGLLSKLEREKRAKPNASLKAAVQKRINLWTKYE